MGITIQHRGFADENLFAAKTTQEKIVPTWVGCMLKCFPKYLLRKHNTWNILFMINIIFVDYFICENITPKTLGLFINLEWYTDETV